MRSDGLVKLAILGLFGGAIAVGALKTGDFGTESAVPDSTKRVLAQQGGGGGPESVHEKIYVIDSDAANIPRLIPYNSAISEGDISTNFPPGGPSDVRALLLSRIYFDNIASPGSVHSDIYDVLASGHVVFVLNATTAEIGQKFDLHDVVTPWDPWGRHLRGTDSGAGSLNLAGSGIRYDLSLGWQKMTVSGAGEFSVPTPLASPTPTPVGNPTATPSVFDYLIERKSPPYEAIPPAIYDLIVGISAATSSAPGDPELLCFEANQSSRDLMMYDTDGSRNVFSRSISEAYLEEYATEIPPSRLKDFEELPFCCPYGVYREAQTAWVEQPQCPPRTPPNEFFTCTQTSTLGSSKITHPAGTFPDERGPQGEVVNVLACLVYRPTAYFPQEVAQTVFAPDSGMKDSQGNLRYPNLPI